MGSPESYGNPEPLFELEDDKTPVIIELGHLGLVDALLYDHPNPPEAPRRWAENPCIFKSED